MNPVSFEGQQEGERILYEIRPHQLAQMLAVGKLLVLVILFYAALFMISAVAPLSARIVPLIGVPLGVIVLIAGLWWNAMVSRKTRTYITDRRIMRFEVVSPFFTTKRALFWNEALKAKAYAPNIVHRILNMGTLEVEPQMAEQENVVVRNVYYFEDLGNYIDKILFTFKNKPEEVGAIKPFVPKPRGMRD